MTGTPLALALAGRSPAEREELAQAAAVEVRRAMGEPVDAPAAAHVAVGVS
jgi:hypothetical protein